MFPGAVHVAVGAFPFELHRVRIARFVVGAVAEVFERAIADEPPFEGLEVVLGFSDPHFHVQMRADDHELHEDRLAVVSEERLEIFEESGIAHQVFERLGVEIPFLVQAAKRKDIGKLGGLLESELDIVT